MSATPVAVTRLGAAPTLALNQAPQQDSQGSNAILLELQRMNQDNQARHQQLT